MPGDALVTECGFSADLQRFQISPGGQCHPDRGFKQGAGGQETRCRQRLAGHNGARAQAEPARRCIRFADQQGRQRKPLFAQPELCPGHQPQPVGQHPVHHRTGQTTLPRQRRCQRHRRIQHHRSGQRIGGIDALDLGQRPLRRIALTHHRHRAEIDNFRCRNGARRDPAPFILIGAAIGKFQLGIAAQDHRPLIAQPRLYRRAHRPDSGNRADPQRQTQQEQPEAGDSAAQFARGVAGGQLQAHAAATAVRSFPAIRPSASRTTRSQRAARSVAWVTRISVAP